MIAWRITKTRYSSEEQVLSGAGAKEAGGRWNDRGLPVVYGSQTSSLALLETIVHMNVELLPKHLVAIGIEIPPDAPVARVEINELKPGWQEPGALRCRQIGSSWLRSNKSLLLIVPSATNPLETNILINPAHNDIRRCTVTRAASVQFDPRLTSLMKLKTNAG